MITLSTKPQVMLDLETMGTRPGCAITAIGAVVFYLDQSKPAEDFYIRIDLKDCMDHGLAMDPGTLMWWLKQSEEARSELMKPAGPLADALRAFAVWLPRTPFDIWGKGPSFDLAVLGAAFDACGIRQPWKYGDERCVRTVAALIPSFEQPEPRIKHHALHDAQAQADHVSCILRAVARLTNPQA